jgi:hypothetical protein
MPFGSLYLKIFSAESFFVHPAVNNDKKTARSILPAVKRLFSGIIFLIIVNYLKKLMDLDESLCILGGSNPRPND